MGKVREFLIGDTIQFKWISSGANVSSITAALFDGSETLVNCGTMTSSSNGFYYKYTQLPNSSGYYIGEMRATIGGNEYVRRVPLKIIDLEVD